MNNFYIKSLTAFGENKTESTVEFSPFLTIISGASNTGKTFIFKCLNYLFGSNKIDINSNTGYNIFQMIINYQNKDISFTRKRKSTFIDVNSQHPNVASGKYYIDSKKENNVNSLYLKLIGINESFKVPYNSNSEFKIFSFRMLTHLLMINEKEIDRDLSIIFPKEATSKTYFLSHLLYLLYRTDFSLYNYEEDKKIFQTKKEIISKYIKDKIIDYENKNNNLKKQFHSNIDLQNEITTLSLKVKEIEKQITIAFEKGQHLLREINLNNEKLTEYLILLDRYQVLETELLSDIKRISFIDESNNLFGSNKQDISSETILSEVNRLTINLNELQNIIDILINDIDNTKIKQKNLEKEKEEFDNLINLSLTPQKIELENKLNEYTNYITLKSQIDILDTINDEWYDELNKIDTSNNDYITYNPTELFHENFFNEITIEIQEVLKNCNYSNYQFAYFSKDDFDIHINENTKSSNGKGFSSFFNSVLLLAFRNYLYKYSNIIPPFYIIDSPLLGLDVGKTNIDKDDLISGIYNYFISSTNISQLIIFENEKNLPNIDFNQKTIKQYHFTHNLNSGRYGFLIDYHD